jgi:hypothetical protein
VRENRPVSTSGPDLGKRPTVPLEPRNKVIIRRILITLVVLACIGGLVIAVNHTETGEPQVAESGGVIEQLTPAPDSRVLRQTDISMDLSTGWTGTMVVDGHEIPEDQVDVNTALNLVTFTPGPGKDIEQLQPGQNCVQPLVWRLGKETRTDAKSLQTWCFQVD